MCVRWLTEHHAGNVDRTSCFDYYEHHGHGTMGIVTVSRRGAGGRMARRLHDLGLAVDGKLTEGGEAPVKTAPWRVLGRALDAAREKCEQPNATVLLDELRKAGWHLVSEPEHSAEEVDGRLTLKAQVQVDGELLRYDAPDLREPDPDRARDLREHQRRALGQKLGVAVAKKLGIQ
jgi:hypothetical protein